MITYWCRTCAVSRVFIEGTGGRLLGPTRAYRNSGWYKKSVAKLAPLPPPLRPGSDENLTINLSPHSAARKSSAELIATGLSCGGVTHRPQFGLTQTRRGCIDRCGIVFVPTRSGEIHRLQFGAVKSVVKVMALGNAWRPENHCFRDQGRTVMCHERQGATQPMSDTPGAETQFAKTRRLHRSKHFQAIH